MPVFLIRHPRPLIGAGICYGRQDVDVDDPLPLASALAPRLPRGAPLFSSPLRRARRLAEALAGELSTTVNLDHRLCEIDFGAWEGCAWNDIDRRALDAWAADILHFTPPGGESVAALRERAIDFADTTLSAHPDAVIVTHAGILRALVGHWEQMPPETWTKLAFGFGEMLCYPPDTP